MKNPFAKKDFPGKLHSSNIIRRYEGNPLLTAADVPYQADFVFNAGVAKFRGRYYIAPRVDVRNKNRQIGEPAMCSMGISLEQMDKARNTTRQPAQVQELGI